jgi:hypothetical protein
MISVHDVSRFLLHLGPEESPESQKVQQGSYLPSTDLEQVMFVTKVDQVGD